MRVLKPGGRFILNIKDHIRAGRLQLVTAWHIATLSRLGLVYEPDLSKAVSAQSLKAGENAESRIPWEYVLVFDKGI